MQVLHNDVGRSVDEAMRLLDAFQYVEENGVVSTLVIPDAKGLRIFALCCCDVTCCAELWRPHHFHQVWQAWPKDARGTSAAPCATNENASRECGQSVGYTYFFGCIVSSLGPMLHEAGCDSSALMWGWGYATPPNSIYQIPAQRVHVCAFMLQLAWHAGVPSQLEAWRGHNDRRP